MIQSTRLICLLDRSPISGRIWSKFCKSLWKECAPQFMISPIPMSSSPLGMGLKAKSTRCFQAKFLLLRAKLRSLQLNFQSANRNKYLIAVIHTFIGFNSKKTKPHLPARDFSGLWEEPGAN